MWKRVLYSGYIIIPAPYPAEFGKWGRKLSIVKAFGEEGKRLEIDEIALFDSQEAAYAASVDFGKDIVDGHNGSYSVKIL